ncbi:hypothetical protein [Streptomyces litchfieldiae]|uniref:Integral membrane protein n=1 Tax=Streptomyces litchfieldiae TaxID=3075543 RepID=A0ABU2MKU0_9ACTN|nr:hypothetical protein [Streptomyces sp. DSM 44938]MDT0342057.1 hypothetical protein [Streptomyces sp. DSM 44938]
MRAGADLRLLRAAVFAAACAALAATGHLAATGSGSGTLPPATLAAGWAVAFAAAVPLAGRERRSAPAIAAALAAGQLALHVLFCLGQHRPGPAGSGQHGTDPIALARRLLCNDHGLTLTEGSALRIIDAAGLHHPGPGTTPHAAEAPCLGDAFASLASAPMLLGHLLAALATGWLLRRGEAALWRLIRLSARLTADLLPCLPALRRALRLLRTLCGAAPLPARAHRPAHTGHHTLPAPHGIVLANATTPRGPPARPAHHFTLAA